MYSNFNAYEITLIILKNVPESMYTTILHAIELDTHMYTYTDGKARTPAVVLYITITFV